MFIGLVFVLCSRLLALAGPVTGTQRKSTQPAPHGFHIAAKRVSRLTSLNAARLQCSPTCDEGHAATRLARLTKVGNKT